ncbi:hypothetical protein ACFV3R_11095 [Streptomyces sp. NPDC059740]|uniref:hypothetical protein n=1 Tax=Streptomyces sp. NPDC059740 TaxID=3346926 RepID=UPI00366904B7
MTADVMTICTRGHEVAGPLPEAMAHLGGAHGERQSHVALAGDNNLHDDSNLGKERLCRWFLW